MNIKAIGVVSSCYRDKFGTPRQPNLVPHSQAKIKIFKKWQPEQSLEGLVGFSHLWVIFAFHLNENERYHAKVHPPRLGGESCGVFATRSPHRPNPIGLSLVKIEKVEEDGILVSGIDLVDETPVLDIKPYLPSNEALFEARGGWSDWKNETSLSAQVFLTEELLRAIESWEQRRGLSNLLPLICETLQLDPRPVVYRGFEGENSKYRQIHAVRLYDGDIHFKFVSASCIEIVKILLDTGETIYLK